MAAVAGREGLRVLLGDKSGTMSGFTRRPGMPPGASLLLLLMLLPLGALGEYGDTDDTSCGFAQFYGRIIDGDPAEPMYFPWQVSIQEDNQHLCGGAVIASQWVLTSANCVNINISFTVLLGSIKMNETEGPSAIRLPVMKVIIHPNYQENRYWTWIGRENNVALLKLSKKLNYSRTLSPICLPPSKFDLRPGSFCWVTGWGQTTVHQKPTKESLSQILRAAEITILSNEDCDTLYHDVSEVPRIIRIISPSMLCSDFSRRKDFCYGDDGSPLICRVDNTWFQAGIVSWSLGCANQETPGVYSRVSEYVNWISREIAELNYAVRTLMSPSWIIPLSLLLPICLMMAL